MGHALETAVLQELQRRGKQVNYVRTRAGFEVDFYARGITGTETLIQVCADLDDPDTLAREVRALKDAAQAWPSAALASRSTRPRATRYRPKYKFIWQQTGCSLQTQREPCRLDLCLPGRLKSTQRE